MATELVDFELSRTPTLEDLQTLKLLSGRRLSLEEQNHLANWLFTAEFTRRNSYLADVIARLTKCFDRSILNRIASQPASNNCWREFICLRVTANDHASEHLDIRIEQCIGSEETQVRQGATDIRIFKESNKGKLKTILDTVSSEMNAASYSFYVSSKQPAGSLSLYLENRVKFIECEQILWPPSVPNGKLLGGTQEFDEAFSQSLSGIKEKFASENFLYGTFGSREEVSCRHAINFGHGGNCKAVLFLNFKDHEIEVPLSWQDRIIEEVSEYLPKAIEDTVLSDVYQLSISELQSQVVDFRGDVTPYLTSLLHKCISMLRHDPENTLATISRFDEKKSSLRVHVSTEDSTIRHETTFDTPQGLITWVALHQKPLLINELAASHFKALFHELLDDAASTMVVPMIVRNDCCGVISIESRTPGAFSQSDLRVVWALANQVGVQLDSMNSYMCQYRTMNCEVLEFKRMVHETGPLDQALLDEFASLAKRSLGCDFVDVWPRQEDGRFRETVGSTQPHLEVNAKPRKSGWTEYVAREGKPVWVEISSRRSKGYVCDHRAWSSAIDGPGTANSRIIGYVSCELGVPVKLDNKVVAVVWLKHANLAARPVPEDIEKALFFMELSSTIWAEAA